MALFDELLAGWGPTVLIGAGVALAAPILLPTVGAVVRPVAKGFIKGCLYLVDTVKEVVAEGGEQLSDLVAEARAEYTAGAAASTATTGQRFGTSSGA